MQDLSNEIREVTEKPMLDVAEHLRQTAQKWACYVLKDNKDKALELGLKISADICHYLNELEADF